MENSWKDKYSFIKAFKEVKKDFYKGNVTKVLYRYLLVIIGSIILAFATSFFLVPANIVSGGVSSLGLIIGKLTNLDINMLITIFQWGLFVLGYFLLGAEFTIKTLISTVIYPPFLYIFSSLYEKVPNFIIDYVNNGVINASLVLLAGIIGGGLQGLAIGLTFSGGGSTGGIDCIPLFISEKLHISASIVTFIVDLTIIVSNFFVNTWIEVLIGILSSFICVFIMDKTYIASSKTFIAFIVSSKWEEINSSINESLERGTTLLNCYGGYTLQEKTMIQVVFSYNEYEEIQKLVYRIDPNAFLTISNASLVTGYGFRKISRRLNREISFEKKISEYQEKRKSSPSKNSHSKKENKPISNSRINLEYSYSEKGKNKINKKENKLEKGETKNGKSN